jgi:hypothetical protein
MKNITKGGISMALLTAIFAVGCSSSSGGADGGDASGTAGAGGGDGGVILYGLSEGTNCFDIVSVAAGSNDGCNLGVADPVASMGLVGASLPVNYVMATATVMVGTDGSLGAGQVAFNMGTLTRSNDPTDPAMATCMWHQTDTSQITVTVTNEFDLSVTEVESMFKAACTSPPAGGTCTSTWTWHMKKGTKTPPGCK